MGNDAEANWPNLEHFRKQDLVTRSTVEGKRKGIGRTVFVGAIAIFNGAEVFFEAIIWWRTAMIIIAKTEVAEKLVW